MEIEVEVAEILSDAERRKEAFVKKYMMHMSNGQQ